MNEDTISNLILQELKLIRKEMKEEIRNLCKSIRFFHFDKTNENAFDSNQDFSRNEENSLRYVNNLPNQNNDVIVQAELIPDSTESFRKCEVKFCAEQCESSSSDNFKSDNLEVEFQLEETELPTENDNNLNIKEINEENLLCETPKPVIVNVKSLFQSKNDSDELNFDVNSSLFERSEKTGKPSINKNPTITDFTCGENDFGNMLEPIDCSKLDANDISHQISNESMALQSSNSSDYHRHIKTYVDNETHSSDESLQHNHSTSIVSNINPYLLSALNLIVERKYICKFCNKTFSTDYKLNAHMRNHCGENVHKCDICYKSFFRNSDLIKHIRIHTGEKPYKCKICDKKFSQKSNLFTHIRIHTEEKPFKCSICDKRFIRKDYMISHTRIHTGEKPFTCRLCNKKFRHNSGLAIHIRSHTGEKPYKCNVCDKVFNQNSDLIQHIRIHTGEKPYKCNVCDKRFSRKDNLIRHTRIHIK